MIDQINTTALKRSKCPHCGLIHDTTCPRIRAMEYHENGHIKKIEFHPQQPFDLGSFKVGGKDA